MRACRNRLRALIAGLLAIAAVAVHADIPYFWLDRPQGRSNPFDPGNAARVAPTPVPTPTLKHPFIQRHYLGFINPKSLAVDEAANYIYFGDTGYINCPVFDLGTASDLRQLIAYSTYPAGPQTTVEDISLAPTGERYICNGYNRVAKLDASENFVQWIGGTVGFGNGQFNSPVDSCVDALNFRVVVADGMNDLVQVLSLGGAFQFQFGGSGTSNGSFVDLCAVKVDSAGRIYAADAGRDDVQVFDSSGAFLRKVDGVGTLGGAFSDVRDMDLGPSDRLFVLERHRLVVYDSMGNSLYEQTGSAWPQQFEPALALDVGPSGKVYISSTTPSQLTIYGPAAP